MNHLSLSFIDQHVLLLLALIVSPCIILWHYDIKRARRPVAVGFFVAAGLLVIGVRVWQDSLASLISTPRALAILVIIASVAVTMFLVHVGSGRRMRLRRGGDGIPGQKDRYHHVWTHVAALVAGTAGALLLADGVNFLHAAGNAPGGTASALSKTMTRVSSGKAAAAIHAGHGLSPVAVLGIGVALLLLIIFAMRRHPSISGGSKRKAIRGSRGPAALPSGSPGSITGRNH